FDNIIALKNLCMKKPNNKMSSHRISQIITLVLTIAVGVSSALAQDPSKAKFLDPGNMNLLIKPGDNFVEYAGGVWLKNNPIPAKETRWGSFNILREFNDKALSKILVDAVNDKSAVPGSVKR